MRTSSKSSTQPCCVWIFQRYELSCCSNELDIRLTDLTKRFDYLMVTLEGLGDLLRVDGKVFWRQQLAAVVTSNVRKDSMQIHRAHLPKSSGGHAGFGSPTTFMGRCLFPSSLHPTLPQTAGCKDFRGLHTTVCI